jgi:hypothetical protein
MRGDRQGIIAPIAMTEPDTTQPRKALRVQVAFRSTWFALVPFVMGVVVIPLALTVLQRAPWAFALAIAAQVIAVVSTIFTSVAQVTVGSDGVLVQRIGERRWLPFADVAEVNEIDGEKLRLTLRSGGHYDLYTHKDQNIGKRRYAERCDELLARIRAGIAAHVESAEHAQHAEAIVARARVEQQPGYRVAEPASADELWSVVDNAAAAPPLRARAAAAIRRDPVPGARPRLLRIADQTADPGLAKALRIAALAEDEAAAAEVEAALAEGEARRRAGT